MNRKPFLPCPIRIAPRGLFIAAVLLCWGLGSGHASAQSARPAPKVERLALLSSPEREDEFPAIGCAADGRLWLVWISYDGEKDEVLVSRQDEQRWSSPTRLSRDAGDCWRPAVERDGSGHLWATWTQNSGGNWDVWASYLAQDSWCKPLRLTNNSGSDICQQLAADSRGRIWMVWQSVVEGNYEILVARVTPDGLQDVQNVSRHTASDWEPAIAADGQGRMFIAWDSYRNGSYDILVSRLVAGKLTEPVAVADSPDYEAHASLAVDRQGRLWVAWDNGGPNWGLHGKNLKRLHSQRSVHVRCLDSTQLLAPKEKLAAVLTGEMARFCELPKLRVDDSGRLWLFVRHLEDLTRPGFRKVGKRKRRYQSRGIWNPYALCYAGGTWSKPAKLPVSNGRNCMRTATCLDGSGQVWVAWAEDGRKPTRAEEPINHNVHAAQLSLPAEETVTLPVVGIEQAVGAKPQAASPRNRYEITVAGVTYLLLYGDTHRHTDISRCGMNYDGSLMDTYRYAIDAAGLDFLAISDHDQDLLKHRYSREGQGPLQDYAWWRSQKYCDLFTIKGKFLPIYGYEHGGSYRRRGGHKNVLYPQRGMPCYEQDSPEELFHVLEGTGAVVIPHQLADGGSATDWAKWNPDFERVAEIFQIRGSYEFFGAPLQAPIERKGNYLRDALGGGVQIGVIASSDHGLVHGAYAGVYAKEMTRSGVLEALRARRSFGATETMVLDFRLGEKLLGEEVEIDGPPTFQVVARGTEPLKLVQIVRDGKAVYSSRSDETSCRLKYTDMQLSPGADATYYLRCQQENNRWAWSSALWVHRRRHRN